MANNNPIERVHAAPRCGAHARSTGEPCRAPAMANGRCKFHGGKSPGPVGYQNALKHGYYTREAKEERRAANQLLNDAKVLLAELAS